jgi:predicted transcriptional regulator
MLTPLELDIMKAVWSGSPITVRTVQEKIRPGRNLAYTTVMTIMDRLYHKGVLNRTLHSRTHYYEPVIAYTAVRDEALQTLIKSFFGSKEHLQEFLNSGEAGFSHRPNGDVNGPTSLDETLL